jgi:hypothetical protein
MRKSPILGLAAALALCPPVLHAQDSEPMAQAPELPVHQDEFVTVQDHVDERVMEFVIGPLDLEAGMPHLRLPIQMAQMPLDGWLHGFHVAMLDADGRELPMDLLHHVNFIDPDKRDVFAPIARRVMAAGRETSTKEMPKLLGYPVQSGDRMLISSMFANPVGRDFPEAYLHVRFSYSLEEDGLMQPRDVYPFYLDVMGPVGVKDFAVPPGKTVLSYEASPAIEGRILGIGGHLHDYATVLRLEDVTAAKVIWEAEPEYSEDGRLLDVPEGRLWMKGGVKVSPDHSYRIYVEYDNPMDHPTADGGMGEIGGVIWASKDVVWPEFNRHDPVYVADLVNTLEAPEKLGGHGHGGHGEMDGMDTYDGTTGDPSHEMEEGHAHEMEEGHAHEGDAGREHDGK